MRGRIHEPTVLLVMIVVFALLLVPAAWAQAQGEGQSQAVSGDDGKLESGALKPGDVFAVSVDGFGKRTYRWCCSRTKGPIAIGTPPAAAGDATIEEAGQVTRTVPDRSDAES